MGAVKQVQQPEAQQDTRYLVPWFVLSRPEVGGGVKHRLISDCRLINNFLDPPKFRLENWREIFPHMKKGMWACKVDLKHAYFHLELADSIKPYLRLQVGAEVLEFQGAAFGISTLPYIWTQVMKVPLKIWRAKGFQVWVYLDDILLVACSKKLLQKQLQVILKDLDGTGLSVNGKKSVLEPSQVVHDLGFILNLQEGKLQIPKEKLRLVKKELGKLVLAQSLTCRKVSSILGTIRSFLMAFPFLRAFSDHLVAFVQQAQTVG